MTAPFAANDRSELGDFESDIAVGKRGEACLLSLVDGNLGLTLAVKLPRGIAQAAVTL